MTSPSLYHAIGLKSYDKLSVELHEDLIIVEAKVRDDCLKCPVCKNKDILKRGTRVRKAYAPPVGLQQVVILIHAARVQCRRCRIVRQVALPGVVPGKNDTKAF